MTDAKIDVTQLSVDEILEEYRVLQLQQDVLLYKLNEQTQALIKSEALREFEQQALCGYMFDFGLMRAEQDRFILCAYCHAEVPRTDITAHFEGCEWHPMSQLRKENTQLKAQLEEAKGKLSAAGMR